MHKRFFAFAVCCLAALATAPPAVAAGPPGFFDAAQSDETTFDVSAVADVALVADPATVPKTNRASTEHLTASPIFAVSVDGFAGPGAYRHIDPGRQFIA